MKNLKTSVLLFFCLTVWKLPQVQAQRGMVAAGGETTGSGGSASYSIGQVDYLSFTSGNENISFGLQQPYEILVMSGVEEKTIQIETMLYPNPVSDFIVLSIMSSDLQKLNFTFFDSFGKIINEQQIKEQKTSLPLNELSQGIYFITVEKNNIILKTFKIIKN